MYCRAIDILSLLVYCVTSYMTLQTETKVHKTYFYLQYFARIAAAMLG